MPTAPTRLRALDRMRRHGLSSLYVPIYALGAFPWHPVHVLGTPPAGLDGLAECREGKVVETQTSVIGEAFDLVGSMVLHGQKISAATCLARSEKSAHDSWYQSGL
ncbi:hypothetical protein ACH5RR_018533 [Cinchona calisaya]|uniref:Uncharacterized protein n=1 Tax=Cinchona calisaya TaxID=153742 RepID=A0ABD2ZML4_9GENT